MSIKHVRRGRPLSGAGGAVIIAALALAACRTVTSVETVPAELTDAASSRFASTGPYAVETTRAEFPGTYGC
ncbi:MAG: hypothetical protein EA426_13415, partial [Spirochaetaceae bacterium]